MSRSRSRGPGPSPASPMAYRFSAEVWEHDGPTAWFFVSLPEHEADEIEATHADRARGFGSIRVAVRIGGTRWETSLFPDSKRATYLLPVKKAVRHAEDLGDGSTVVVELEVLA